MFLFANVGDDSEHPATLRYVREVAMPFAERHGITIHELQRHRQDGSVETIYGRLTRKDSRSLPIPVRMSNGAPGARSCTGDFKIKVLGRWLRDHGASPVTPATVGIGISVDEISRANNRRCEVHERVVYPLLDLGLRRVDCQRIIADAGLPVPSKSACWFCPFHTVGAWQRQRADEPELFERACALEDLLNERRDMLGKDHVFLSRYGRPLREVVPEGIQTLPLADDDVGCDSGWCMT